MTKDELEQPAFLIRAQKRRVWHWIRNTGLVLGLLALSIHVLVPQWFAALFKPLGHQSQTRTLPDDPLGIKYLSLEGTKHSVVTNANEGRLLVVTGLVKNYYAAPRRGIRIHGRLLDARGHVLDQQQVYGGTWLDRESIESFPYQDIQNTLTTRSRQAGAYADSGHGIPFQIVFNQVSEAFAGYTLEVTGSEIAR